MALAFAKFIQASPFIRTLLTEYGQNAGRASSIPWTVNEIEDIKKIKRIT
jgi:hypothetical protein